MCPRVAKQLQEAKIGNYIKINSKYVNKQGEKLLYTNDAAYRHSLIIEYQSW